MIETLIPSAPITRELCNWLGANVSDPVRPHMLWTADWEKKPPVKDEYPDLQIVGDVNVPFMVFIGGYKSNYIKTVGELLAILQLLGFLHHINYELSGCVRVTVEISSQSGSQTPTTEPQT